MRSTDKLYDIINIISFNRPIYFEEVLNSIVNQTTDYSQKSIHIWIDGYRGSLDEAKGKPNRTEEVTRLAQKYIPNAVIHRFTDNIGIARIYQEAEKFSLSSQAQYALFFEDDLVLSPSYIEALELLMNWASEQDEIAIVTAHGYVHEYLAESEQFLELPCGLYYVHSMWAYAVKIQHLKERQPFIDTYIKLMDSTKYYNRNHNLIRKYFYNQGLSFIPGTSQDYAKHAALWAFGKCAVTISIQLSKYIGREGEHSDEANFVRLGYNNSEIASFDRKLYKELLPAQMDYTLLKALRLMELETILAQVLMAENQALISENQALQLSKSWRLTAPLRSIADAMKAFR